MLTSTQCDLAARLMAEARRDVTAFRRRDIMERAQSILEELARDSRQGEAHEKRLAALKKNMAPLVAEIAVWLERQ